MERFNLWAGRLSSIVLILSVIALAYVSTVSALEIAGLKETGQVIELTSAGSYLDLLELDNTWTGDNTFEGEVHGTAHIIQTGHDVQINMGVGVLKYMKTIDGVQFTNAPKGWTAEKDGSIIGMSVTYDIVSAGGTGFPVVSFKTLINGVTLGSPSVGGTASVGNQQNTRLTWDRDVYSFSAGDNLQTVAFMQGFGGTPILVMDDIIINTRIVYDE